MKRIINEYNTKAYDALLAKRIGKVLMICSNYDAFIMEEDGRIDLRVSREYQDLDISSPPEFVWANSAAVAGQMLSEDPSIDLVICMFNEIDPDIFPLAERLKEEGSKVPFVLLMHYSREIRRKVTSHTGPGVDYIFSWHGNADLILAIIKLLEDEMNAEADILGTGVQAILLVEDSIRYYSTYLPELYRLIMTQCGEFLKETLNEEQQRGRKRSRPKVLLATNYNDAVAYYRKYSDNLLGIISDIGMVLHRGDDPSTEKLDAGIDLVKMVRQDDPLMPIILQSSQGSLESTANALGVRFLRKYSRTLFLQLAQYIREEFGFGDIVFRDSRGVEYGRAGNLQELEEILSDIPDEVLVESTSRNMFSKWFFARGLFTIARRFRQEHHTVASEARDFMYSQIHAYRKSLGRGVIADFRPSTYDRYVSFARMGEGSLGGKARGLAFLNRLIESHALSDAYPGISITIPRSVVICADYFDEFITDNGLQYVIDSELSDGEILSEFVASRLPERLIDELKVYLDTVRTPLAIRSSSKLEDSNYQPFAGVYSTYMIPLAENRDQMLRMLDKAIKSVYASAYYGGSRSYVQSTGNLQSEEKMSVIVQTICGSEHGGYYYPLISGVGRSINFYPIGSEKADDGIVNVVYGLGKGVVEGGKTLRFSPRYPKKILQLSQPSLALRDTQKTLFALDMRPRAFKISRDEGVNLARLKVEDTIPCNENASLAFSTYDRSCDRVVPGTDSQGPRIVSFDALLRYGKFPLAKALEDILSICKSELMCDTEIEFAADISPDGETLAMKLLQVRPVGKYSGDSHDSMDSVRDSLERVMAYSPNALGVGYVSGIDCIVQVPFEGFDSSKTRAIASEIASINARMKDEGKGYFLVGPGRWGSQDPNLGIPVAWSDISEARMIAECSIEGFRVEPSQGTHFFQNITSLGVGYLTMDLAAGKGSLDLGGLKVAHEGKFTRVLEAPEGFTSFIDSSAGEAIAGVARKG